VVFLHTECIWVMMNSLAMKALMTMETIHCAS